MDKDFIQEMHEKLLAEKARVEAELLSIGTRDPHNPENFNTQFMDVGTSEDDSALEATLYNDELSQEQALEDLLRDINSALARIEKGDYGICKYCKKEIGEKRLRARPEAGACVDCKQKFTIA
jgi:RNA polymerase-binding protein DksA